MSDRGSRTNNCMVPLYRKAHYGVDIKFKAGGGLTEDGKPIRAKYDCQVCGETGVDASAKNVHTHRWYGFLSKTLLH